MSVAEQLASGDLTLAQATELAHDQALRTLTAAGRSRVELAGVLVRKGFPSEVVAPLLDRFEQVGLLDDAGYAAALVRTRHGNRGLARRSISCELRRRGIAPEVAETALQQVSDDDEHVAAEALAQKLLRRTTGLDPQVRLRRAAAALARRGYAPSVAFDVVKRQLAADGHELLSE